MVMGEESEGSRAFCRAFFGLKAIWNQTHPKKDQATESIPDFLEEVMNSRFLQLIAPLLVPISLTISPALCAELKGVNVPETLEVEGHVVKLQGLGLRKKLVFSVYVAALYLSTPTSDPSAAVGADEPKRIALHFLRDVSADKIRQAFEEGFFNNSQERLDALGSRIERFLAFFDGEVEKGQSLAFTYLPDRGTQVALDGGEKGRIEGRDFMEALWSVWLGDVPPSHELKKGMLGEK